MDTVNRIVVYKFFLSMLVSLFLTACGSDSSDSLNLTQLEQYKGRANTPSISEVAVVDGDTVYLNQNSYGEIFEGLDVRLGFTAEQSGYTFIKISGVGVDLRSNPLIQVSSLQLLEFGESSAIFYMEQGEVYGFTLSLRDGELVGSFELELIEANRESLQLSDHEYVLDMKLIGDVYYDGMEPFDELVLDQALILNFSDLYQRSIDPRSDETYGENSGSIYYFEWNLSNVELRQEFNLNTMEGDISGTYFLRFGSNGCRPSSIGIGGCEAVDSPDLISSGLINGSIIL